MTRARLTTAACGALLLTCLGGCPSVVPQTITPELPAALQHVVDNAGQFTLVGDIGLNVDPVAMDDATELDGCWGHVAEQITRDVPNVGDVRVHVYEAYHFEPASGAVTYEVYFEDNTGAIAILMIGTGTFSVPQTGLVEINITEWTGNNTETGAIEAIPSGQPRQTTLEAGISGSTLVLTEVSDAGSEGEIPDPVYFVNFTCP